MRGTWTLLEACRAHGVVAGAVERIVVASSDKAYGDQDELPYREDLPLRARFPYDVSKACTDMIARSYATTYGMPVAVTRLANVYGPGDVNWSRIVPDTARALARGERPVIRSDGTPERDYLYVEDAVDAYLAVAGSLDDPTLRGRAWNAGSDRPLSVLGARAGADAVVRARCRAGHPGGGDPARRDRPPVARLDRDPLRARLGAALGAGARAGERLGVVLRSLQLTPTPCRSRS